MRYVVTGAAGFIGSHPRRVPARRRARGRRSRLLHRLLRPGVEGGERTRARRAADRPGRGRARLRRFRRCLPPRGPAGRAQLRRRLPALPAAQRARDPAGVRGRRRRRREGRLGELVVGLRRRRAVPDAEDVAPRPNNPYGITKLACEQLHDTYARVFGLRAVALRYFTVYGPRQRPDMAFARIVAALAADEPFELYGDGSQSRSFTYVADVVAATTRALEASPGHLQRRRRGRGDDAGRAEPARSRSRGAPCG